jgi:hypothetical protein
MGEAAVELGDGLRGGLGSGDMAVASVITWSSQERIVVREDDFLKLTVLIAETSYPSA